MTNYALGQIGQGQAQNGLHQSASNAAQTTPREIGIIDRVNGLASGTAELASRLEMFVSRLANTPQSGQATTDHPPLGLLATLSQAEVNMRRCFEIISALHDAF